MLNCAFVLEKLSFTILVIWWIYWTIKGKIANYRNKKTKKTSLRNIIERFPISFTTFLIFIQFLGLKILPFTDNLVTLSIGFIFLVFGVYISISGREALGTNWTAGYEYQIKRDHLLIKEGIYKYIRHPIYTGMLLIFFGAEIIIQSYLFLFVVLIFLQFLYWARREEILLTYHFGKEYKIYMKSSKMFIPFVL